MRSNLLIATGGPLVVEGYPGNDILEAEVNDGKSSFAANSVISDLAAQVALEGSPRAAVEFMLESERKGKKTHMEGLSNNKMLNKENEISSLSKHADLNLLSHTRTKHFHRLLAFLSDKRFKGALQKMKQRNPHSKSGSVPLEEVEKALHNRNKKKNCQGCRDICTRLSSRCNPSKVIKAGESKASERIMEKIQKWKYRSNRWANNEWDRWDQVVTYIDRSLSFRIPLQSKGAKLQVESLEFALTGLISAARVKESKNACL
ncbi:hypothetical protein VNO78_02841 [Psophocarpus tetragonolobus]|uniref:Uncharacterized protein n=1 Tax=Psophocarpus tetragonolobus TaxID=3891 RepID=A0AAN9XVJ5_PSOTE